MTIVHSHSHIQSMKLAVMAVSLGGVETLVEHPASTTHNDKCVPREVKIASGITDGLLRLRSGCVCYIYPCGKNACLAPCQYVTQHTLGLWSFYYAKKCQQLNYIASTLMQRGKMLLGDSLQLLLQYSLKSVYCIHVFMASFTSILYHSCFSLQCWY